MVFCPDWLDEAPGTMDERREQLVTDVGIDSDGFLSVGEI
jgi:hypothetical protein